MKDQAQQIADHFFRHEAGNLRAALTRVLGMAYLDFCDDVVQEAMYRALTKWPVGGVPPDPTGWIFRTARNIAIDHMRRDKLLANKTDEIRRHLMNLYDDSRGSVPEEVITDSLLRMVFTCCDPELSPEVRIVLTLKVVCSFHTKEIASALLKKQDAVERMVSRGKKKLKTVLNMDQALHSLDLQKRLGDVLQVVYLLFNEGYKATAGEKLIKTPLSLEAIRLAKLLAKHPATASPATHALTALLLFHAARFPSRVDAQGHLMLLELQDRSQWDQKIIADAFGYLNRSATGAAPSDYHLLAGIAACHAFAPSYEETDWALILDHYDLLLAQNDSPVLCLNRVVVLLKLKGAVAAKDALKALGQVPKIGNYYLYHMVVAEIAHSMGDLAEATAELELAKGLTNNAVEKAYIERKISRYGHLNS